jgi:site-specific recombinase XerD
MEIKILAQKFFDYSKYIRGFAAPTLKRYKQVIFFFTNFAQITDIEQVSKDNTRNLFYYGRTSRNWTSNTLICYHKSLAVFFKWCVREGYMTNNPMDDIEVPRLERRLPSKLNKQEALRLMEVAYNFPYDYKFLRYRNHAIFAMFILAGIRKKELLNLKFADVEIDNMSIFIRQGKGSKDRAIPMNYKLADILTTYVEERKRLNKTCPEFFTSLNRNSRFTDTGLKRLVEKIVKASGIKFTIHKLRHTFATLMLEGGCDIYSLAKMMGHNDIKTTTIYLAADIEHLRSQITKHPLNNI